MGPGNFFAGLFFIYHFVFLVFSQAAHNRKGWFFCSVGSTRTLIYAMVMLNDLTASLIYFYLTFIERSFVVGRSVILMLAHLAFTAMFLGKFEGENDSSYAIIARPVCFALGLYWYYLAAGPGVSMEEILDMIGEFLDA